MQPKRKARGCGCIFSLLIVMAISVFVLILAMMPSGNPSPKDNASSSSTNTPEDWLAFDARSWEDFVLFYNNHNSFMNSMTAYADGYIDKTSMYLKCEEADSVFGGCSISVEYGENQEEKDYLSVLRSIALSDQAAARSLKKYLNSGKTSDLADAQTNIEAAKNAVTLFASNRGALLVKAGLSDEEIKQKVESDMTALNQ